MIVNTVVMKASYLLLRMFSLHEGKEVEDQFSYDDLL